MDNWPELTITHTSEGEWVATLLVDLIEIHSETLFGLLSQIEDQVNNQ